jgi:hypothetical protein
MLAALVSDVTGRGRPAREQIAPETSAFWRDVHHDDDRGSGRAPTRHLLGRVICLSFWADVWRCQSRLPCCLGSCDGVEGEADSMVAFEGGAFCPQFA